MAQSIQQGVSLRLLYLIFCTQDLCKAREREKEAESHFKAIADRETGRLRQEIGQLENELENQKEKQTTQEVIPTIITVIITLAVKL